MRTGLLAMRILLLATVVLIATRVSTQARTWHVEKDGSGDYTVIQDALDAAAPGDSVVIGPGTYDDHEVRTHEGVPASGNMFIEVAPLTVIGAGKEATLVGPEVHTPMRDGYSTMCVVVVAAEVGIAVEDTGFRNTDYVFWHHTGGTTISRCGFQSEGVGQVILDGVGGVAVESCSFNGPIGDSNKGILSWVGTQNPELTVRRCVFNGGGGSALREHPAS